MPHRHIFIFLFSFVAIFSLSLHVHAAFGDVTTYISDVYSGDGGTATEAYFDFPEDVTFDSSGNYYIADTFNHAVRKVDTNGTVSTVAGTGSYGNTDGAATSAEFAYPRGVVVDSSGNIYVADGDNNAIRKISGSTVSTLVSSGLSNPSGVTIIGSTLYIADRGNGAIKKVPLSGGTLETVTTNVTGPVKLIPNEAGSGVYVADLDGYRVLEVNISSGNVQTIVGTGANSYAEGSGTSASLQNIGGLALDTDENILYVNDGDGLHDRVSKIALSSNTMTKWLDNPDMTWINNPRGMALSGEYLYTANAGLGGVMRYTLSDGAYTQVAGKDRFGNTNGSKSATVLGRPYASVISPDGTKLYSAQNNQFKVIDLTTGASEHILGTAVDAYREGAGDRIRFSTVTGITINSAGDTLYVIDHWNNRVRKIDIATKTSSLVSGGGETNCAGACNGYVEGGKDDARFDSPSDVVISPDDTKLYVTDTSNNRLREVDIETGATRLIAGDGTAGNGSNQFNRPYGLEIDGTGQNLYVADSNNHRIVKVNIDSGSITTVAGSGQNGHLDGIGTDAYLSFPEYISKDVDGKLYFSEVGGHRIKYYDPDNQNVITIAGSGNRGFKNGARFDAEFNNPKGLSVSKDGSRVYVSDSWNDQIRAIDVSGEVEFSEPRPSVLDVGPENRYKVAGSSSDTKMLEIIGDNFRHGAVASFNDVEMNATYVQSAERLTVEVPFGQLTPGYYDVTVINIDGQGDTKRNGFTVLNADGSLPAEITKAETAQSDFYAYDRNFRGGYDLAAGQLFRGTDGEIVAGLLEGFGPQIRTFDKDGNVKSQFFAFAEHLRSGVKVAVCDLDGDGLDEIVAGAGRGGRPHIRTFDAFGNPIISPGFFALDGEFKGGVNIACENVSGSSKPEIIVAAAQGGGPHVTVHKPTGEIIANFFAYGASFRGGIQLGTADMDGDGIKEIITGPQVGASHVQMFGVRTGGVRRLNPGFFAFHPNYRGGLSIEGGDTNANGKDELVVAQRAGGQAWVKVYRGRDQAILKTFLAYDSNFEGGAALTVGDVDNDERAEVVTMPGSGGAPHVRVFDVEKLVELLIAIFYDLLASWEIFSFTAQSLIEPIFNIAA